MIAELVGKILMQRRVRDWLIAVSMNDPDEHIKSPTCGTIYMYRFWLFNRITNYKRKYPWIPFSIRMHRIMRADVDRHLHDHPFWSRRWVLSGGYEEVFPAPSTLKNPNWDHRELVERQCLPGFTSTLDFNQYHRITKLADGGSWSLFVIGDYKGDWGFMVNGEKIPHKEYIQAAEAGLVHEIMTRKAWNIERDGEHLNCQAVQHSDLTICKACDIGWDTNDPQRPACDATVNPARK